MLEKIDFSKSALLTPRSDSWPKVVARIQAKKDGRKMILFRRLSSVALAASVLLVAGAFLLGIGAVREDARWDIPESSVESIAWFSALGSGESVSTFSTDFDNYYYTGE